VVTDRDTLEIEIEDFLIFLWRENFSLSVSNFQIFRLKRKHRGTTSVLSMGMTGKVRIESSAQSTDLTSVESDLGRAEGKGAIDPNNLRYYSFWIFSGEELVAQEACLVSEA
jgi:hypothetical protein